MAVRHRPEIEAMAVAVSGTNLSDPTAEAALAAWLRSRAAPEHRTDTAYLLADVVRRRGKLVLRSITMPTREGNVVTVRGADLDAVLRDLLERHPGRWFVPHALDLLGWMDDRGLDLPKRAVDPALVAFILDPDAPIALHGATRSVRGLPPSVRNWLGDHRRALPTPSRVRDVAAALPALDQELGRIVDDRRQRALVEDDVGATLPILAKIERGGARIGQPTGVPSWKALLDQMQRDLDQLESAFVGVVTGVDPYTAEASVVVDKLKARNVKVPTAYWHKSLSTKQELLRMAATGRAPATALLKARSLASPSGTYYWLNQITSGRTDLRGTMFPQTTGRWGFRKLPVQNLVKHGAEAKLIRSGLVAPDGYVLVGADFNSFEIRLLAALSGDPVLLAAAQTDDVHSNIAGRVFGAALAKSKRDEVKKCLYAIGYGQTESGFWRSQSSMPIAEAKELYAELRTALSGVFKFRRRVIKSLKLDGYVETVGAWRRYHPGNTGFYRKAFNTVVQGLGADILRWVLRRLARDLHGLDVRFLHQAHDELILAARPDDVEFVAELLGDIMEQKVAAESRLLPRQVRLVAKVRKGATWADLLA
jgi:DNA polymerase I-like protein with 3'-5' exonuclease and polymerase domains